MDLLAAAAFVILGGVHYELLWSPGCEWRNVDRPLMYLLIKGGNRSDWRLGCWEYQGDRIILYTPGGMIEAPRDSEQVDPSEAPCPSCSAESSG